ncbi:NAD(P)-binding protein [Calocera cornea HHB12733]|uniref:NAD(P)-binding protein n=1 Tax=Calocera cornea HHB12733 TaxID=1353952 RepID=A0A165E9M8_9BASI|nr:NAD(P)-binding protein [Calocera cornea HHB12733]
MSTLEPGSLIVITGLTGYIASHIGLVALRSGFHVRGTVRSRARGEELREAYTSLGVDASPEKLCFTVIDDLTKQEQFERAFEDVDAVIHVALPEPSATWVQDSIASNVALLNAAKKAGAVKRIVLTSSSAAVHSEPPTEKVLDDKDWNDGAIQRFQSVPPAEKAKYIYGAAKTLAEREAWKWMEEQKPSFDLVALLPNANFGPLIFGQPRSTADMVLKLFKGDTTDVKRLGPQWYIDVRDTGALHVLSLTDATVSNTRIWAAAGPCGANEFLAILRKNFPQAKLPEDIDGPRGESSTQKIDSEKGRLMLGGKWRTLEDALVDMAKSVGY